MGGHIVYYFKQVNNFTDDEWSQYDLWLIAEFCLVRIQYESNYLGMTSAFINAFFEYYM